MGWVRGHGPYSAYTISAATIYVTDVTYTECRIDTCSDIYPCAKAVTNETDKSGGYLKEDRTQSL